MQPAVLIRLKPTGPWRFGPGEGGQSRLDLTFRSDRLYSAVTLAMSKLGLLDSWLGATARSSHPAVSFTSLLPFQGDVLFAPPPATLWPPPPSLVISPNQAFLTKLRWTAARFVPLSLIEAIVLGQPVLADQWIPDPDSGCLLRRDRPGSSPLRTQVRSAIAVDRLTSGSVRATFQTCVEFEGGSGFWTLARYANREAESEWNAPLESAFRLLADSGFGARRTSGWGQTQPPEFQTGEWPRLLLPKAGRLLAAATEDREAFPLHWLLSLYVPASTDSIDWKAGDYSLTTRGGHVENGTASGTAKKIVKMIVEGSVISSEREPVGAAVNVAPDGFAHPVYRSGFAVSLKLPAILRGAPAEVTAETVEPPPSETDPPPAAEDLRPETIYESQPIEPVAEESIPQESDQQDPTQESPDEI